MPRKVVAAMTGTRTGLAFQGSLEGHAGVSQAEAREGHIRFHCHKSKRLGLQAGVAAGGKRLAAAFVSFTQTRVPRKRELQLRNCFHHTGT